VLASSSSGNSTFIATDRTRILVDVGLSRKDTMARLAAIGEDIEKLDAILITHEHSDHVCGLVTVARNRERPVPIHMTRQTADSMPWGDFTPVLDSFPAGTSFTVGDIDVSSFTVPHDAIDPVGFCFRANGVKIGVVTDLGYITDSIRVHLKDTDLLLLESNHSLEMLRDGPYPWPVRQRVMSRMGHLSNEAACEFIKDDLDLNTSTLILGHLSAQNNNPARVHLEAMIALETRPLFRPRLVVAEPGELTEVFTY
jgi:phosphoribosyl 1,2-cyclic phosphodiesterase